MSFPVEGVTWELSKAASVVLSHPAVNLLYGGYIGLKSLFTGELKGSPFPPNRILHTGIVYHGHVYEYSTDGIKKTVATESGDPGSVCAVEWFLDRTRFGKSNTTLVEFDTWIYQQKQHKFSASNYDVSKNNCVHFTLEVLKLLDEKNILLAFDWLRMIGFTEQNPDICMVADECGESSNSNSNRKRLVALVSQP